MDQGLPAKALLPPPPVRDQVLAWLCLSGIIALSFLMNFHTLVDTDIFWHLKTGQIIFSTHRVPHQDLYSFTRAGKEWIDAQGLFQLILYSLYRFSGYTGMILFGAMLTAITWALLMVPGFNPNKYISAIALGLIALLASAVRLKLRPEILSFFYIALELLLLDRFRRGEKRALYPLPFLLLLWVNSEGLWPIYFVILSVFLLEELLFVRGFGITRYMPRLSPLPPKSSAAGLLIALLVSIPAAFLNPYGPRGVVFPWVLFEEVSFPGSALGKLINEFRNPFTNLPWLDRSAYFAVLIFSAIFFATLLYRRRIYPAATLLWLGFLLLSASALRNVALFSIITLGLSLQILAQNRDLELFPFPALARRLRRFRLPAGITVLGLIIFLGADIVTSDFFMRNRTHSKFGIGALETEYPIRAGGFLKEIMTRQGRLEELKIFPDAEASAYLIWTGNPEWKVYVDPRLEVYGEEFLVNHARILGDWLEFSREDQKYDFDAVVVGSFQLLSNLIVNLYHDPQWSLVYLDGTNVVFLKDQPRLRSVIEKYRIDFSKEFYRPVPRDLSGEWLTQERLNRGILLSMLGQPQWALPEFEEAVKLEPDNPELNYNLGWTLNVLQRFAEALPYLEKSASMEPGAVATQIQLGRAYAMTGQTGKGLEIFRAILEKDSRQITACMDIAKVHELILRSGEAAEAWERCWAIYQSDPQAFQMFGADISQALERLGPKK